MTAPRLYLRTDEPCSDWWPEVVDFCGSWVCHGCNGDGTRATYTPVNREYARQVLAESFKPLLRVVTGDEHWHAADVALDALGVES